MKRSLLFALLTFLPPLAQASPKFSELESNLNKIPRSLQLELNTDGFQTASKLVYENFLKELNDITIPDQEFTIAYLFKVKIQGIQVNADWNSLAVKPNTKGLQVNLGVNKLDVNVGRIVIANALIPFFKTTCQSTSLKFGKAGTQFPITADIGVGVENERLQLDARNLGVSLSKKQYSASGPSECHGILGLRDYLSQFIMNLVVKFARGLIVDRITSNFAKIATPIESKLNELIRLKLTLDLEKQWIIPETRMALSIYPTKLDLTQEKMLLELGTKVKPLPLHKIQPMLNKSLSEKPITIASLGFNPEVINKIFGTMFIAGGPKYLITQGTHEILEQFLDSDELSYFWPDLLQTPLDTKEMRATINFTNAPEVLLSEDSKSLDLKVRDFATTLQIKTQGKWKDYFTVLTSAQLHVTTSIVDQVFKMSLSGGLQSIDGYWAQDYKPTDDTFHKDEAMEIFTSLTEFGLEKINPISFRLPIFDAKGTQLGLSDLRIDKPFIKVNVQEWN